MGTDRINTVLADMSITDDALREEMLLDEDLGLDSLRLVELMVMLEEPFGVEFEESDLDPARLLTVGDAALLRRMLLNLIANALGAAL